MQTLAFGSVGERFALRPLGPDVLVHSPRTWFNTTPLMYYGTTEQLLFRSLNLVGWLASGIDRKLNMARVLSVCSANLNVQG
jgi:hypothetical protein